MCVRTFSSTAPVQEVQSPEYDRTGRKEEKRRTRSVQTMGSAPESVLTGSAARLLRSISCAAQLLKHEAPPSRVHTVTLTHIAPPVAHASRGRASSHGIRVMRPTFEVAGGRADAADAASCCCCWWLCWLRWCQGAVSAGGQALWARCAWSALDAPSCTEFRIFRNIESLRPVSTRFG
jgi:hypothetical protein